ncbi:MAG: hypothetical protein WAK29_15945 [Terriglobales bacterium]
MSDRLWFGWLRWAMLMGAVASAASGSAQEGHAGSGSPVLRPESSGVSVSDSILDLREQVRELQAAVAGMRSDWQQARAETAELRRELDELRAGTEPRNAVLRDAVASRSILLPNAGPDSRSSMAVQDGQSHLAQNLVQKESVEQTQVDSQNQTIGDHAASLEEQYELLSGKVDDQYQTKVESASKYRLRVSGIVLMNLFSNQGAVDNIDFPTYAFAAIPGDSHGSFGATLRQSEIGFETFGPTIAGAKTKADLQLDLAGGFPSVPDGVNAGLMRLRTATMRLDWANTSVVAGQDALFFSPTSPTSFASLAIPALSSAGNLWGWIPQVRVEHRVALGEDSNLLFQGGILDPVSGETPYTGSYRLPGPGEQSRQPAYAARVAWTHNLDGQPFRVGFAGYYSRLSYGMGENVDAWAGMADIELPLGPQVSLSGKAYRGRGIGGFYGAFGQSALFSGAPNTAGTEVQGLDSVGGWAQLKYRPTNKWEFNAAFGLDNPYAADLEYFYNPQLYGGGYSTLGRNRGSFVNMIYRPRSDLLFSAEYRRLTTFPLAGEGNSAGHLNLMMGVLF